MEEVRVFMDDIKWMVDINININGLMLKEGWSIGINKIVYVNYKGLIGIVFNENVYYGLNDKEVIRLMDLFIDCKWGWGKRYNWVKEIKKDMDKFIVEGYIKGDSIIVGFMNRLIYKRG